MPPLAFGVLISWATNTLMKKHIRKTSRHQLNFGDLIQAVSSSSNNSRETVAAVTDLLESGLVRFESQGRKVRAHVRM